MLCSGYTSQHGLCFCVLLDQQPLTPSVCVCVCVSAQDNVGAALLSSDQEVPELMSRLCGFLQEMMEVRAVFLFVSGVGFVVMLGVSLC